MSLSPPAKDLIVLVADADMREVLRALVVRWQERIQRTIRFDVHAHPQRDHGVYLRSLEFLLPFGSQYRYALIAFDRHGCGADAEPREALERAVEIRFDGTAWDGRVAVIAIDPELEAWVWSDSPHLADELRWPEGTPALRTWLRDRDLWPDAAAKPPDPKKTLMAARREKGCPASASLFGQLAGKVSLRRCTDPAFRKLLGLLEVWFPDAGPD